MAAKKILMLAGGLRIIDWAACRGGHRGWL